MIRYALRCAGAHGFEGWFRSSDDFDLQAGRGLLSCPSCGTTDVSRGLMAPAVIGTKGRPKAAPDSPDAPQTPPPPAGQGDGARVVAPAGPDRASASREIMPDAMRAALARLRDEVEKNCDDVGREFADQALRMHRGDIERRGIYGQATEAERETLADEGVEVGRIPWLPRSDS